LVFITNPQNSNQETRNGSALSNKGVDIVLFSWKALAEPVIRNSDNRPRLFFYIPAYTLKPHRIRFSSPAIDSLILSSPVRLPATAPGFSYLQTFSSFSRH